MPLTEPKHSGRQDFAGTRSDFVIVGHPEYNLGKALRVASVLEFWRGKPFSLQSSTVFWSRARL